jgi:pectate lyase
MIAALALAAATSPEIVQRAEPWAAEDRALIARLFASPPAPCASDGVTISSGRVVRAEIYDRMTGFARSAGTVGGLGRPRFLVSRGDDPSGAAQKGSLRWAVAQAASTGGGWIAFAPELRGATIALNSPLRLVSNVTLDGGCAMPRLVGTARGSLLYLRGSRNVVVTRLRLEQRGGGSDGDCITVSHGADRLWLAFLRLRQCRDGLIDVTRDGVPGPMRVTISNNRFSDHDKAMLVAGARLPTACGALKSPIQLTVARNIFYETGQRHPRANGDAFVHLHDKVIALSPRSRADGTQSGAYGTLAAEGAQIVAERTLYIPPPGNRKYRLLATTTDGGASGGKACKHGHIDWKPHDAKESRTARRDLISSVISATEPPTK